ncbi:MAG: 1-acyl-sn-glycerol-3-phosphate acyltransferase [Anaerolineae bacterium]|nr:1-acyl-sn-glycerol-3-phosphate acyltransferase [Anaerolineae bacterium]
MADSGVVIQPGRRRVLRAFLKRGIQSLLKVMADVQVTGRENFPKGGPLLVIFNHFSFVDPPVLIGVAPWYMDFFGGTATPNAPKWAKIFQRAYGVIPTMRGTGSRYSILAGQSLLSHGGVLAIAPEGGSWATVLRPARPGTAVVASRVNAPVLPVGLDGMTELFPRFSKGKRSKLLVNVGKPIGPFYVSDRGTNDRAKLDEIGHTMMRAIAELIPPEVRGFYSDDPARRQAAKGTEIYPWQNVAEV